MSRLSRLTACVYFFSARMSQETAKAVVLGAVMGCSALLLWQRLPPIDTWWPTSEIPEHCPGPESAGAGKGDACQGCPNQEICASGEAAKKDPGIAKVAEKLQHVKKKVLVLSGKGGVGKSTVSAQLAFALAKREKDVGLLDVDICGPSIPKMLGLKGREVRQTAEGWSPVYLDDRLGVMSIGFLLPNEDDAIVWRGPRKNGIIKQFLADVTWGDLDYLIVDTPPGTSDEHLSIVTYLSDAGIDGAILVTTPQEVALQDVRKEINFCRLTGIKILGVIENMSGFSCPSCNEKCDIFSPTTGGAEKMCELMDVPFLGRIPMNASVMLAGDEGHAVLQDVHTTVDLTGIVNAVVSSLVATY